MILICLFFTLKSSPFFINLTLSKHTRLDVYLFLSFGVKVHLDCVVPFFGLFALRFVYIWSVVELILYLSIQFHCRLDFFWSEDPFRHFWECSFPLVSHKVVIHKGLIAFFLIFYLLLMFLLDKHSFIFLFYTISLILELIPHSLFLTLLL